MLLELVGGDVRADAVFDALALEEPVAPAVPDSGLAAIPPLNLGVR